MPIIAAAIKFGDLICTMPKPCRHHDIIHGCAQAGMPLPIVGEQGFITASGRFLDRRAAAVHAVDKDQIARDKVHSNGMLYTEDLW